MVVVGGGVGERRAQVGILHRPAPAADPASEFGRDRRARRREEAVDPGRRQRRRREGYVVHGHPIVGGGDGVVATVECGHGVSS